MNANGPVTTRNAEALNGNSDPETAGQAIHAQKPKRLLLVASAGGHWVELSELVDAFAGFECHFVTTVKGVKIKRQERDVIQVRDCSRNAPLSTLRTFCRLFFLIRQINPDIVLSTGAAPGAVALIIAKLRGKRTVWIESLANCEKLSLSALVVRPFADVKLTQWEHLAERHRDFKFQGRVV